MLFESVGTSDSVQTLRLDPFHLMYRTASVVGSGMNLRFEIGGKHHADVVWFSKNEWHAVGGAHLKPLTMDHSQVNLHISFLDLEMARVVFNIEPKAIEPLSCLEQLLEEG